MNSYQAYKKENTFTVLDMDNTESLNKKCDLLAQGFEEFGYVIKAENPREALISINNGSLGTAGQVKGLKVFLLIVGCLILLRYILNT